MGEVCTSVLFHCFLAGVDVAASARAFKSFIKRLILRISPGSQVEDPFTNADSVGWFEGISVFNSKVRSNLGSCSVNVICYLVNSPFSKNYVFQ